MRTKRKLDQSDYDYQDETDMLNKSPIGNNYFSIPKDDVNSSEFYTNNRGAG